MKNLPGCSGGGSARAGERLSGERRSVERACFYDNIWVLH